MLPTPILFDYLTCNIPFQNLPSNLQLLELCDVPQLYSISRAGPTPSQIWSFQCLQRLKVDSCENLKFLFSMEVSRSLPELVSLIISDCQELEQVVAADEELVQLHDAEFYFPKLRHIVLSNCNKLKSLFPFSMVRMFPQLSTLEIRNSTQLEEVFEHGPGDDIIGKIEVLLPNLTEIQLVDLPNFVDICQGCKLHAVELLELGISYCPKTAPSLRQIQVTFLPC